MRTRIPRLAVAAALSLLAVPGRLIRSCYPCPITEVVQISGPTSRFSLKRSEATSEAPPPRSPAQERACSRRPWCGRSKLPSATRADVRPSRHVEDRDRRTHRSGVPSDAAAPRATRCTGCPAVRHPADMACSRALPRSYRRPRSRRASRVVTSASPASSPRRSGELDRSRGDCWTPRSRAAGRRTRCLQDGQRLTLGVTGQPRLAPSRARTAACPRSGLSRAPVGPAVPQLVEGDPPHVAAVRLHCPYVRQAGDAVARERDARAVGRVGGREDPLIRCAVLVSWRKPVPSRFMLAKLLPSKPLVLREAE